jgi:pimeloyl-ACP methyl ester carboxylesterase
MTVLGAADFYTQWQSEVQCQDQFRPEIRPALTAALLEFDPLGSTWGKDGVRRAPVWNAPPGSLFWGVNSARVGELKMPTLIIRGETDGQITLGEVQALYRDLLGVRDKVLVHVACASHYLVWENQHEVLLRASEEWLRSGTFGGQSTGIFRADREGRVTSAP